MSEYPHAELTGMIIGAAFEVHNALGPGFLESIYEEALAKELKRRGIPFSRQVEVYLAATGLSVALLLNFSQKRLDHKRLARTMS